MANYKVKYFMEFDTIISQARVRVEFHKKDYALSRTHRLKGVGGSPLTISYQGEDTLRSAEITIQFVVQNRKLEGLKNFWTATERDWKILIYVNDAIYLESFLLVTDHSTEPMTDNNYVLTLKATDGLSLLDAVDFKTVQLYGPFKNTSFPYNDIPAIEIANDYLNKRYPITELLAKSLTKTEIGSEINEFVNIYDENMVTSLPSLFQALIHLERLKGSGQFIKTRKVLEAILETFCQICFQKNGKWTITSLSELSKTVQKGRSLDMTFGSLIDAIQISKNETLAHASKNTRFYFVNANAIRWHVAPLRKMIAKIDFKGGINLLKAGNFLYYDPTTYDWGFWERVGDILPQRIVEDGYNNVMRFNGNGLDPRTNFFKSETVIIPPKHGVSITFSIKRKAFIDAHSFSRNLMVKFDLRNDNNDYRLMQYIKGTTQLPDGIIHYDSITDTDFTFKGNTLKTATSLVNPIVRERWGGRSMWFSLYNYEFHLPNSPFETNINDDEYVEHTIVMEDISVLNNKLDSIFSVSFAQPTLNVELNLSRIEIKVINQNEQIVGERIELTNDEQSKVEEKSIDLNYQDDVFENLPHTIINGRTGKPTVSWRRLGREEGKSLGELTAEMTFNNLVNHRPFFQTDFKIRTAPYNYGDTFSYENYKYLPQDYEYDVKNDEVKAKIIRPIGDCDYNHKAEFWDTLKEGGEISNLTKRYVIDSKACADVVEIEPFGQFFEFSGMFIDGNEWKEAEGQGTGLSDLPYGQFFAFGGLFVEDNLWHEAEGMGAELTKPNFGQLFEFGGLVDENYWKEAQGAGVDLNLDTPYGQFFEFELSGNITLWNEAENMGRTADFSADFSDDFDSIE